jgi:Carboxypeptidase regulatory-like domain/TonB dependent receptor
MAKHISIAAIVVTCLCLLSFTVPSAEAQAVYGGIIGTVTDPQGAAVANAKVTVTNQSKGTSDETTTNADGNYSVTHLIPDVYSVRVEASGFKASEQKGITVSVDSSARVDLQCQVGGTSETVEVTGEAPQLKTDRADVASTFTERQVENLPIFNRNFTTFQLLSPGTQRLSGWNHAASENPQGSQQILTNGQSFAGTAFELDGTDNQDPILGIIVINPNLDSINEVKITQQDYDAEFGKAIGSVVTSQTKSGSNQLHGSVFDYERSNSNFARNPFTQSSGVPKGNWNQFGFSVGGPIKKDKLFFFGDYQGTRSHVGGTQQARIMTQAERSGNLSLIGKNIYDPYETTDASHQTLLLDGSGNPILLSPENRTQFPGNVIPASRLSPQTQALLSKLPVGANGTGLQPNFFGSGSNVLDSDGFDVRPDYYATNKLHVFTRYSYQKFTRSGPGLFGTALGGNALPSDPSVGNFAGNSNVHNQSIAGGFDYTVSDHLLTDFRFGYMRYNVGVTPGGIGTSPAKDAGIPGLNLDSTYTSGMPAFRVRTPGASDFMFGYSLDVNQCNCPLTEKEHQYQFVNNWTWIRGNHSIKFGADLRAAYNLRVPSDAHRAGQLDFNNDLTQGPGGDGGVGMAGFLLGYVSYFTRYVSNSTTAYETQPRMFFYGQDTWRITPKLTVNYGLRWEIYKPESASKAGGGGWLDLATGEMRVAGQQGVNLEGNTKTSYTHFAPRIGLAYQMTPKTVLRIGYGRSYDVGVFGSVFGHAITQNLPVLASQQLNPGSGNVAFWLNQGPPSYNPATGLINNCNPITDPSGTKTTCLGVNGRSLQPDNVFARARPFNNRLPTVDAWNISLQHQITSTITISAAYVGNKGTHTLVGDNPAYNVNSPTVVGYNPSNPQTNLRKPFYSKYGWTQGIDYFGNDANNKYNSFQFTTDKKFANGLLFQASYTFQHASNDDPNYYNIDPRVMYGPNNNYRNQTLIFTHTYELPFGKGKKYAGDVGRAADLLIGGWALNGAWNFSSGLPFTPSLSSCSPSSDTGPCRPDKVGAVKSGKRAGAPQSTGYWFETTPIDTLTGNPTLLATAGQTAGPWGQPAVATFGNVGRNTFHGPRFFNADMSLFKSVSLTEQVKFRMEFQFFNVFNRVSLANPNSCVDCGNAGSITDIAYGLTMRRFQFGGKFTF